MNTKKSIAQLLVVSLLGASAAAFAQEDHRDQGHGGPAQHGRPAAHAAPHRGGPAHDAFVGRPGGPVPHADWHQGDRLPAEYRDRNYVVDDWHEHGLRQPPRGYEWVGVNGDYVLVAVATGLISSILAQ